MSPPPHLPDPGPVAAPLEAFVRAVVEAPRNRRAVTAREGDPDFGPGLWTEACWLAVRLVADPAGADPREALGERPLGAWLAGRHWPAAAGEALRALPRAGTGEVAPRLAAILAARTRYQGGWSLEPMVRIQRRDLEAVVPTRWAEGAEGAPVAPERFFLVAGQGRKQAGVWYTPPALARRVAREALPVGWEASRLPAVLDPAVGGGALLEAALWTLARARTHAGAGADSERPAPAVIREVAASALHGIDLDPVAVEAARWRLAWAAEAPALARGPLASHLVVGDALTGPRWDALLAAQPDDGDALEGLRREAPAHPGLGEAVAAWVAATAGPGLADPEAALCPELAFPEVFARGGFDVVVGNPPWEVLHPRSKEFLAARDPAILDAPTRRERSRREAELLADPAVARAWAAYRADLDARKRLVAHAYPRTGEGGGSPDLWQLFAERSHQLLRPGGRLSLVLPSAFHANQGSVGLRRLLLLESEPACCLSFENRDRLFDIDSRFKYAVVAARKGRAGAGRFRAGFYLRDPEAEAPLTYDRGLLERAGGAWLTLPELRSAGDVALLDRLLAQGRPFGAQRELLGLVPGRELDMTNHAPLFEPVGRWLEEADDPRDPAVARRLLAQGRVPLHEGKTFHQWDDRWGARPRYVVPAEDRPGWEGTRGQARLTWRAVAASTNERTAIFTVLPPGVACGNSAITERAPAPETRAAALALAAVGNSFVFDWALRVRNAANVNLHVLDACPVPAQLGPEVWRFLVHGALRLVATHRGFSDLWSQVMGRPWSEATPGRAPEERVRLQSALDAAVAWAWGLDRAALDRVLAGFRHPDPRRPETVRAAFDRVCRRPEAFLAEEDPLAAHVPAGAWRPEAPTRRAG